MLGLGIRAADPFKRFYQHVEFGGFGFQAFLQKVEADNDLVYQGLTVVLVRSGSFPLYP